MKDRSININLWDTASVSVLYSISILNIICYCVLLLKIRGVKDNSLFEKLSIILLSSQIFYIVYIYFSSEVTRLNEDSTNKTTIKMQWCNILAYTCDGFYLWGYCSAHWIFAIRYWFISYKLA